MTDAAIKQAAPAAVAARTRLLLEGPIVPTMLRIATPNLAVNVILIAVTASVDAHFVAISDSTRWPASPWCFRS